MFGGAEISHDLLVVGRVVILIIAVIAVAVLLSKR